MNAPPDPDDDRQDLHNASALTYAATTWGLGRGGPASPSPPSIAGPRESHGHPDPNRRCQASERYEPGHRAVGTLPWQHDD